MSTKMCRRRCCFTAPKTCVSHEQSIAYAEALNAVGVHAEVEIYKGKPHAWFNKEPDRTVCYARMETFLVEQFGLKTNWNH